MDKELLRQLENDVLRALITSLEWAQPTLKGHGERVASYAVATACELGLDDSTLRWIRLAAALHDLGMLALPTSLIQCPQLDDHGWRLIRQHPELGVQLVQRIERFRPFLSWIRSHHERWDGGGYPEGLAGEQIPLGARIIAVSEAFDAMTFPYPGRPLRSEQEALAELQTNAGSQFDPKVVEAFLKIQSLIQPLREMEIGG